MQNHHMSYAIYEFEELIFLEAVIFTILSFYFKDAITICHIRLFFRGILL